MAWKIGIQQLPIPLPFGTYYHNIVVVLDDAGNKYAELNGGPVDGNGNIITSDSIQGVFAYTSGAFPLGVREHDSGSNFFYNPSRPVVTMYQGSQDQVIRRLNAARACAEQINSSRLPYVPLGVGPIVDRDTGQRAPGYNSNGAANTLLQCMGAPSNNTAVNRQPGANQTVLSDSDITEIIQQQNVLGTPGNTIPLPRPRPEGNPIPLPRPRPEIRGDNSDGSYTVTTMPVAIFATSSFLNRETPAGRSSRVWAFRCLSPIWGFRVSTLLRIGQ